MTFLKIIPLLVLCVLIQQNVFADWVKQQSGTLAWLHAVHFVDQNVGWIAGSNGTLLSTIDGGRTWAKQTTESRDTFRDIYFADRRIGWILSESASYSTGREPASYLMHTVDGGRNWRNVDFAEGGERMIRLFFSRSGNGFAIGEGGVILSMQDGEKPWKMSLLPVRYLILDGMFLDELNGIVVGGGGTILSTNDNGASWNKSSYSGATIRTKLNAVDFVDRKMGWFAGSNGKIYATNDGGKSWREQISPVAVDLFDIVFSDSSNGYAVGDNGTILRTVNSGSSWMTETTGIKHRLERVSFAGGRVYAVGFGGTIMSKELNRRSD